MFRRLPLRLPARTKRKASQTDDNPHELSVLPVEPHSQPQLSTGPQTTGHNDLPLPKLSWWKTHIAPDLPEASCRDHFALERTFLAYVRTASAFAQIGVTIAQLFKLTRESLDLPPSAWKLGHALGPCAQCFAIVIMLVGAFRCWRQQDRIAYREKSKPAGNMAWLLMSMLLVFIVLSLTAVRSR